MIRATPPPTPELDPEAAYQRAEQVAQQAEAQVREARKHIAIRKAMQDPDFRLLLLTFFEWTDPMGYSDGGRREGAREIGGKLKELMDEADPMLYPELIAENAAAEARRRMGPVPAGRP